MIQQLLVGLAFFVAFAFMIRKVANPELSEKEEAYSLNGNNHRRSHAYSDRS